MSGYYGTELQKELQRQTFENRNRVASTPGLYNAGRFIGTDDPDKVGWANLRALLREQKGVLGFRLITPEQSRSYFPLVIAEGCRIDTWDVFIGEAASVGPVVDTILESGLPDGLKLGEQPTSADGPDITRVQKFVADSGVAPLPGSTLIDAPGQATVILTKSDGALAAVANTYFAHNAHSAHWRNAWVGMVVVNPAMRGLGLGRLVNALAIKRALTDLGAERVHELVSPTNEPSRRMVQSCGLTLSSGLLCGVAIAADAVRFSR